MARSNENGSRRKAADKVAGGQAKATKKQIKNLYPYSISAIVKELRAQGLALRSTATDTQLNTLPKVLQYLGERGFSTYEAQAAGYLRIATRIKELKDAWDIITEREDVIGPDGLMHRGVGRYKLLGKKQSPQLDLGLGV